MESAAGRLGYCWLIKSRWQVEESTGLVEAIAKRHGAGDFEFARDARERQTLWSARKELFWSTLALRTKNSDVWSTDVAVPLSRLSDIIGKCSPPPLPPLFLLPP